MIDVTVEAQIDRTPEEVFAYATDPAHLAEWQTNTVSAVREDEGPMREGSRLREVHAAPGGRELHSVVEVARYEPPVAFDLRVVEGTPIHADIRFEPAGSGTLMSFRAHGTVGGAMRLVEPLLAIGIKRQFAKAVAALKTSLEAAEGGGRA